MKDAQIVVGVDIGSAKIAAVVGQIQEDTVNILGVSEIPSRGVRKGQIVDIEEASTAINSALDIAERMAGASLERVFASISGVHIESQNSRGIVAIAQPDREISQFDVDRVLEAAGAISMPSTRSIIHVLPKSFIVDGEGGIKDPTGMNGVRLEVDTHIVSANSTSVKNIYRVLEQEAGVSVNALVYSGLASSLATLSETEKELGVILVDIGGGITNICVFVDGALSYSSVIPIGARHITNDLAIGLRISLESAEKIKLHLSHKFHKKKYTQASSEKEEGDEIDLGDLRLVEDLKKVSQKTLVEGIIRPRLNELFTMVALELKKSGLFTQTPAGIVITGGGARTVGAEDSAKRMLAMPVRIGTPIGITGLIDEVENPSYATAVGILMYGKNFRGETKSSGGMFEGLLGSFSLPKGGGGKAKSSGGSSSGPGGSIVGKIKKLIKNFIP